MQAYDPAIHILRRGLSETSTFTWLILGGLSSSNSDMAQVRQLQKVGLQFISCMSDFLDDANLGPDLRVEAVVCGKSASEVLSLVPDYGTRLIDVFLDSGVLFKSSKNWPYFVDERISVHLRRFRELVRSAEVDSFNHDVSFFFFIVLLF